MGAFVATSVAGVVFGGIQSLIYDEMGWTRSTIGLTASAGVWLSGLVAPFAGRLADRYGGRWLMASGTVILAVCLYMLGGAQTIWLFFLMATIGRAISQPLLIGVVPHTLAVNFFRRRRNLALALTGIMRPVSSAIIIQAIAAIAVTYGWRAAFRGLGVLSLLLTIPIVLLIRHRPEDIGLFPDGANPDRGSEARVRLEMSGPRAGVAQRGQTPAGEAAEYSWTPGQAWRTKAFWVVSIVTLLGTTANSGIGFNMVPYLHEQAGITTPQAVGVLSLATFLSLSSLVWAPLADRFTPRWCIFWTMLAASGTVLYMFNINSLWSAYVFGVLWGISSGAGGVLTAMIVAQFFGRESYGSIIGTMRPFEAGGLGLGQAIGTLIYDFTGSYRWLLWASLAAHLLAASLIFIAKPPEPPQPSAAVQPVDLEAPA